MSRTAPTVSIPCPDQSCNGVLRLSFAALGHLLGCCEPLRCPICHQDMRHQLQMRECSIHPDFQSSKVGKRSQGI